MPADKIEIGISFRGTSPVDPTSIGSHSSVGDELGVSEIEAVGRPLGAEDGPFDKSGEGILVAVDGDDDGELLISSLGETDGSPEGRELGSAEIELGSDDGLDDELSLGFWEGCSEVLRITDGPRLGSSVKVLAKPTGAGLSGVSKQIDKRATALGPYIETLILETSRRSIPILLLLSPVGCTDLVETPPCTLMDRISTSATTFRTSISTNSTTGFANSNEITPPSSFAFHCDEPPDCWTTRTFPKFPARPGVPYPVLSTGALVSNKRGNPFSK